MIIACRHWRHHGVAGGGLCKRGLYGGLPSFGVCLGACPYYTGTPADRRQQWSQLTISAPKPAGKCGGVIVRWPAIAWDGIPRFGPRWYGLPWPVRLWRRIRGDRDAFQAPGCGCLVKGKALWVGLKSLWITVKRA